MTQEIVRGVWPSCLLFKRCLERVARSFLVGHPLRGKTTAGEHLFPQEVDERVRALRVRFCRFLPLLQRR